MQAKPKAIANALLLACGRKLPDGRGHADLREPRTTARWTAVLPGVLLSAMASGATHTVTANSNMTFTPSSLSIAAGDTVTFKNNGGLHNVSSDPGSVTMFRCANGCDGAGGNGDPSGEAWSAVVAFPTAGTIRYFCEVHGGPGGVGMAGKITVTGAVVMARLCDFNGDAHSDILWRNNSTGTNSIWRSANSATPQTMPTVALSWRVVGVGDYNGDGHSDVLWRNGSSGANTIWRSASSTSTQAVTGVTNQAWTVAGSGDYNGDGTADILWRNTSTGANTIWRSANAATTQAMPAVAVAWKIVGSGDYNGDGHSDILWRNSSTGANAIWRSGSSTTPQAVTNVTNLQWTVVGSGDYDGDGHADILWRNTSTGANTIWRAANSASTQAMPAVGLAWRVVGSGDYNGDGRADILWRNTSSGANVIWLSGNSATTQTLTTVTSQAWTVVGFTE